MRKEDYFVKSEQIDRRIHRMVVLDVHLDNLYGFRNFHMNLTYPKKIIDSSIQEEHLQGRPNFRYKKVNIVMGANATGKSTFGRTLMKIFNFVDRKNLRSITEIISDRNKDASFVLDLASRNHVLYRIACTFAPCSGEKYEAENVHLSIQEETIQVRDSYQTCIKRLEETEYVPKANYLDELEKIESLDWLFEYPADTGSVLKFPTDEENFGLILENILKALDPAVQSVEKSNDVENAYVVRLKNRAVILQNGDTLTTTLLSSGTKAGVGIAQFVSAMRHGHCSFYYCDEKFPYIHSDVEKAALSLMIDSLRPNDQLFFTTHNTDILDMDLPKHSFTFLRKNVDDPDCPITCITASSLLKRSSDSLKKAVENDLFSSAPAVDLIYGIADI